MTFPQPWFIVSFPPLSCKSGFPLEHVLAFKFMIHIVNLLTAHSIWNLYLTFYTGHFYSWFAHSVKPKKNIKISGPMK